MLRQGKPQAQQRKQCAEQAPINWSQMSTIPASTSSDGVDDDENYHPAPNFQSTFSNGLDAAFHRMKLAEKARETADGVSGDNASVSKKKRKKATLLFSTGSVPRL